MKKSNIFFILMVFSFLGLYGCAELKDDIKYTECRLRDNTSRPCNW